MKTLMTFIALTIMSVASVNAQDGFDIPAVTDSLDIVLTTPVEAAPSQSVYVPKVEFTPIRNVANGFCGRISYRSGQVRQVLRNTADRTRTAVCNSRVVTRRAIVRTVDVAQNIRAGVRGRVQYRSSVFRSRFCR